MALLRLLKEMMEEIIRIYDADDLGKQSGEEGIEIPLDKINPDTLRRMLSEFVTREWADEVSPLESRIDQVLRQLHDGKAKIMYEFKTETWNIVQSNSDFPLRRMP